MTVKAPSAGTPDAETRKALERFVVENDDLLALESRIGRFNIFDALSLTRAEIRHSNFLAFILDPVESHGQGQLFLKAVLMDLFKIAPADLRPLSPIDLDGTDLRGVDIKREWNNIDLLITCMEPRFAIVIENKVGSQEHSDQLSRYQQTMRETYSELTPLYIYLTPQRGEPSEDSWVPYSYADIYRVLKRIRDTYQNAIGDEVLVFLEHYLNLLETRFMNDDALDELCKKIYKKHRQALDLIWERVGSPESAAFPGVVKVLEEDSRWHVFNRASKSADFVPKTWLGWLPPFGTAEDPRLWISVHLGSDKWELWYVVAVTTMKDALKRTEIVTKLREKSPALGFKRTKTDRIQDDWARIAVYETILEWGEDEELEPEEIREKVKRKLDELLDELYARLEKIASVLKPLCKSGTPAK